MQLWFDQTQSWCNLTWMLLHTASASGSSSCTGTGTLVFSTRDSQAGSSILDHGDAFDHIFMTTKIKQILQSLDILSKSHKDSPMKVQQTKGLTSSDITLQTNSEVPTGDSAVLLTPTLKQVATARSATAVPLLSVLMKWSRKPGEPIWFDGLESSCFSELKVWNTSTVSNEILVQENILHGCTWCGKDCISGTCAHHLKNHWNSFQSRKYKPNNLQVTCAPVPNDPTLQPSGSLSLRKLGTSQCPGCHWEFGKYLFYMHGNYLLYMHTYIYVYNII